MLRTCWTGAGRAQKRIVVRCYNARLSGTKNAAGTASSDSRIESSSAPAAHEHERAHKSTTQGHESVRNTSPAAVP
jgi:hypothetical protein